MSVVSGCVIGPDRQPVKGAHIMFARGPVALPDIAQICDAAGKFSLTAPVAGIYSLLVTAPGFLPVEREVKVSGKDVPSIEIRMGENS